MNIARTPRAGAALLVAALLLATACGMIEDTSYNGKSLLELTGTVELPAGAAVLASSIQVGLLWLDTQSAPGVAMLESQVGAQFPASYDLTVFSYPSDELLITRDELANQREPQERAVLDKVWPEEMKIGLALIVVWEDLNQSDTFDNHLEVGAGGNYFVGPDRILGGAKEHVVVFVDGALPPAGFYAGPLECTIDGSLPALGYTLLHKTGERNCCMRSGTPDCGGYDQVEPTPAALPVALAVVSDPDALAKNPTLLFPNLSFR